jgi:hypothetical protein
MCALKFAVRVQFGGQDMHESSFIEYAEQVVAHTPELKKKMKAREMPEARLTISTMRGKQQVVVPTYRR